MLNFDADREFEAPGYTPSRAVTERLATLPRELVGLVRPNDVVLGETSASGAALGLPGLAWCPTPKALERLRAAGAILPRSPSRELLARVNARKFSAELGLSLPESHHVDALDALLCVVAKPLPRGLASRWCLKSAWSASGSGRRLVAPGGLPEADLGWARRQLPHGLQVEPWVERVGDFALHGYVNPAGVLVLGRPTVQRVDGAGRWCGSELAGPGDLEQAERTALTLEAERAAAHLSNAGYFGPFNVDAFRYRTELGVAFVPRCEINARYTMGWAIGMSGLRPDLDEWRAQAE